MRTVSKKQILAGSVGGSAVRHATLRFVRASSAQQRATAGQRRLILTGVVSVLVASGWLTAAVSAAAAAPAGSPAGTLYGWGDDTVGQLGDGSSNHYSLTPVRASLPGSVKAIAVSVGSTATLALGSDGSVYAWGDNTYGQLGDGSTASSLTPVQVPLPGGVKATAVSEGGYTSLAVGSDGNVYAWGDNTYGQLGDGSTARSYTPVQVPLPGGVTATAVSEGLSGWGTSLALGSDGNVYAWGDGTSGALGDGSTASSLTPVRVALPAGATATAVSEGVGTGLALGSDGNVYAWGNGSTGELGIGFGHSSSTPVRVGLPVQAIAVAEGAETTVALGSDGAVYGLGNNGNGELGNGSTSTSLTPVRVSLPGGVTATAVSEGDRTTLALGSDGNVYAWGANNAGQLGLGSTAGSYAWMPVQVPLPAGVTATAVSEGHDATFAITGTATTTVLSASPNPAIADGTVTLTATEVAADSTYPAGYVQFEVGGTNIGVPLAVNASGVATTTTTFATAGTENLSAVFTPTNTSYSSSTGTSSLTVNPPAIATMTSLAVIHTGYPGGDVSLSTTVSPAAAAGTVSWYDNGSTTPLSSTPVTVSNGLATFDAGTGLAAGGHSIVAVFTPANPALYAASQSAPEAFTLELDAPGVCANTGSQCTDVQNIEATIPVGALVLTTPYTATNPLNLGTLALTVGTQSLYSGTAAFNNIAVVDTRAGDLPWTLTALASNLTDGGTNPGSTICAQDVGLTGVTSTPETGFAGTVTTTDNAAAAPPVAPSGGACTGTQGLGGTKPHTVAAASAGLGTDVLNGTLTLTAPTSTEPELFTGTITLTVG